MIDVTNEGIPRSRRNCENCEATPAGCRGVRGLSGRYCCATCDRRQGDHDRADQAKESTT